MSYKKYASHSEMKLIFAVICALVSFAILRNYRSKPNSEEEPQTRSLGSEAALFFFLLVVFIGVFYWLDIGNIFGSSNTAQKLPGGGSNIEYEREFIKNIREDVNVGMPNF